MKKTPHKLTRDEKKNLREIGVRLKRKVKPDAEAQYAHNKAYANRQAHTYGSSRMASPEVKEAQRELNAEMKRKLDAETDELMRKAMSKFQLHADLSGPNPAPVFAISPLFSQLAAALILAEVLFSLCGTGIAP